MDEYTELIRELLALPPDARRGVLEAAQQKRVSLGTQGVTPPPQGPEQHTAEVANNLRPPNMATKPTAVAGPEALQKMRSQGAKMGAALRDILRG